MKKGLCVVLSVCIFLLAVTAMSSCAAGEKRRDDGSLYLEGTYIPEAGVGDRVFVFTKDLLVMFQVIYEDTVEFHYEYEILEEEDRMHLVLTYKGLIYDGNDPDISWYLTGMRNEYSKNPKQVSDFEMGDGYIVVSDQKLIKQ
ncbi:MAG: hypothetical protein E7643_06575 [Ruminococcaceae bacterium]|nr:hypothetical protein [Oscillospiraceae bacterium]